MDPGKLRGMEPTKELSRRALTPGVHLPRLSAATGLPYLKKTCRPIPEGDAHLPAGR